MPDLDEFVDALATRHRIVRQRAISETKRFADVASLPPDFEIAPEWDVCPCIDHAAGRAREDQKLDGARLSQAG
jgi:hypothetical protein